MTRRRVLPFGDFSGTTIAALHLPGGKSWRNLPACQSTGLAEPEAGQVWNVQLSFACSAVRCAACAGLRNMSDRIGAGVTIGGSVRRRPDTDRIHYKDNGAHWSDSDLLMVLREPVRLGQ